MEAPAAGAVRPGLVSGPRGLRRRGRRWSAVGCALLVVAVIGGAVAAGAVPSPRSATSALPRDPSVESFAAGNSQEVRRRLDRQRQEQRATRSEAQALARQVEDLRRQHERISEVLEVQRRRARGLARRIDYLVPRLLARQAEVHERRAQAAQALAELAARSRGGPLDATVRARMLAISPFMLEQLRGLESRLGAREDLAAVIERQARIERRLSGLSEARQQVAERLAQTRRLHRAALERLRELNASDWLLAGQQAGAAQGIQGVATASAASTGLGAPARVGAPAGLGAEVEASAGDARPAALDGRDIWDVTPRAEHRSALALSAAAATAALAGTSGVSGVPSGPASSSAGARVAAALRRDAAQILLGASHDAIGAAAAPEVAFEPPRRLPAIAATLRHPLPLLPATHAVPGGGAAAADHPAIAIAAAPGQAVAAPVDGRIVFAGPFKGYGLLLIIEQEREYHTLLWGFAWLDVGPGDYVQAGQVVGIMGTRDRDPAVLHVERRRHGRPINLAATSSGIQG